MGNNRKAKITIIDVAKKAGVTPAIVSRVFNSDKALNIKEETRDAVLQAIRELDYHPNAMARNLRTQSSKTIGVVIADIMNPFFTEIIKGIQTAAESTGYSLILADTGDDPEKEMQTIVNFDRQNVDGIILGSSYLEDNVINTLEQLSIKYVMLNRASSNAKAPFVRTNDLEGMVTAVQHLLNLGHKRIAYLSGPLYADTAIRRLHGYRKALREAGVEYNQDYVLETRFDVETGYVMCKRLMELNERPTAICAGNDLVAIGAMRAIKELGLIIPYDISLVGYNDIWIAPMLNPCLTTIHTPLRELGKESFNVLQALIEGNEEQSKSVTLETSLVVRESTASLEQMNNFKFKVNESERCR